MAQSTKFDVEATLAKLTMPQKIKLLAGKVCAMKAMIYAYTVLTTSRVGGILNPYLRLVYLLCA